MTDYVPSKPPQEVDPSTPLTTQATIAMREQLDWVGPTGKKMGHVILRREIAEALLNLLRAHGLD